MASTERIDGKSIRTHRQYIMDVRIVEPDDGCYRFEAPRHEGIEFDDAEIAELYADIYFDVNGFEEAGTGYRGVPPIIIQAGRDTLAAYLLTQPYADRQWVGSFMGVQPGKIERYVSRVRKRATNIRRKVTELDDVEFALTCAECSNTVDSEGETSRIGGELYHFCCPSCQSRFEERHQRLEEEV